MLHSCTLAERSSYSIWKFRTSSFKCYADHSHTMYNSGNIDVQNWVHLFESCCIFKNLLKEVLASSSIKISSQFSWLSSNWNSSILWSLMSLFVVILFILFCKNNIFYHYYLCLVNRKRIDMGIYNIIFSISQHKFATGSKSTVPCAAGYCMVKNHTIT